jgi:hypothetical protein
MQTLLMFSQAVEEMPSKFTLQELILVIVNRADVFEILPMLDLFIQKIVPFHSIEDFAGSALVVARQFVGIDASRNLPQLQSWAFSVLPAEGRPQPKHFARSEHQFDQEIEIMSLFVGIALLTKQPKNDSVQTRAVVAK